MAEENVLRKMRERIFELLKLFPLFIIAVLLAYALNSSARSAIDDFLLQTPARGFMSNQYEIYPAFLDEGDVVVRRTMFNDTGIPYEGLIIEVHKPVALAQTPTNSMMPMFGSGNLLVQEKVDKNTQLNIGEIVVYESPEGPLVVHQIISIGNDGCIIVKGINNPAPDPLCVRQSMVKYRLLFSIPTK